MLKLKLQYFGYTSILWCKELIQWKRPWCWERLRAGGEEGNRGWDSCLALTTQWTWVWVNSGGWWWTGWSGVLQSTGSESQTQLSDWNELNWTTHTVEKNCLSIAHMGSLVADTGGMKVGSSSKFIFSSSLYSLLREIYTSLPFCLLLFCLRSQFLIWETKLYR